ncbi:MAG: hypothetical protein ACJ73E_18135 [Mycobacteriales bacterium]
MPRDAAEWARGLGLDTSSAARPMPRRVVDGVLAETLRRPLWCVAVDTLAGAEDAARIAAVLHRHGRQVVLISPTGAPPAAAGSVREACAAAATSPADAVLVLGRRPGADRVDGGGARRLTLDPDAVPERGGITLRDAAELDLLFARGTRYRSASTYHEV